MTWVAAIVLTAAALNELRLGDEGPFYLMGRRFGAWLAGLL